MPPKIMYTYTDEAPALATHSLLPIIEAFVSPAGVMIETRDISLTGRILAAWNDKLPEDQRVNDALAELGELAKTPEANIIKLPNISASLSQLKAALKELQDDGYELPDYREEPSNDEERDAKERYDTAKGSNVNPVLREGNSDRRAPKPVKEAAQRNPHSMGPWSPDSKTAVATMGSGDFRSNEQSATMATDDLLKIVHTSADGAETVLKEVEVLAGEVVDATYMSVEALRAFLDEQLKVAEEAGILFSVHLKATMMKVSDPIIFGHAVRTYFADVFDRYGDELRAAGADPDGGLGSVLSALDDGEIKQAITERIETGPDLAYVNSHKGITGLHVPSDTIIDASMPAMIRSSGQMWNADDETQDCLAVIPDSSYAAVYDRTIAFVKENGQFDPATMGTVQNVGLMAQKAEEYGSHDKTFEIEADGRVDVIDGSGEVVFSSEVAEGDIWRMCQTKDEPIRDWVKLAVGRAKETGWPTIFWLDADRPHDAQLIEKVNAYLADHDTDGLDIRIMSPADATVFSLERVAKGENTISVTGNVLRDYLTDLFPILELGTSAKMLSIVPLMQGGGLFETGAGGSAPKHVQQLVAENHLRWDSLGEFLALAMSLRKYAEQADAPKATVLGEALDDATGALLEHGRSPSRKVGELDNRGSHFYLALYWAQALAKSDDAELAATFGPIAEQLGEAEEAIVGELNGVQGSPVDLGGYYLVDRDKTDEVMRPSKTLNGIIDALR
jgi:isocitrate dehydrogenase